MTLLSNSDIHTQVQQALNEDLGHNTNCEFMSQDVTASLIPDKKKSKAQIICSYRDILRGRE